MRGRDIQSSEQGASTVELALATLLCVPMAIFAVYAGEAFVASIKAQEAEISAGWETTAYLTHKYADGKSAKQRLEDAATDAATRVFDSLKDFDSFEKGGRVGLNGVFGYDQFDELKCKPTSAIVGFAAGLASDYLHADGWVNCQARVTFENRRAPTDAHKEFFHGEPKIIADSIKKMQMCGSGSTLKGCEPAGRGFTVFTDDWGLENPAPEEVGAYGGGNKHYWNVGNPMFSDTNTPEARAKLEEGLKIIAVGFGDQGETDKFKMGYMETVGKERTFSSHTGEAKLHLSPFHEKASKANEQCADLSEKMYEKRVKENYLAMPDRDWNGQ